ncbi:MAG: hypothetical protein C4532_05080 [Candidatus Abyssobacteria bacterium SURF_17]|jgi:hypothetical protein|uniref:Uncharacterized protein n=1 Tax=Candidatus Abyssobacteria bacterium SURF_17 TaxID=2093361 RepID=A0A419F3J5_9BACT|nr:MAG: hypothetical protein C4532_05080 [Candidatus Abyssubacteria bacterium SURF_17]
MNDRGRKRKGAVVVVVLGILLGAAILFLLLPLPKPAPFLNTSRGQAIEDFLADKNAFGDYLTAIKLLPDMRAWDTRQEDTIVSFSDELFHFLDTDEVTEVGDKVKDYIEKCQPSLQLVRQGIRKNDCVVPEYTSFEEKLPYLAGIRGLARVLVVEGKIKELSGDYYGACENYLDAIRLGNDIAKGGVLIHGLVNLAINGIGLEAIAPTLEKADARSLEMVVKVLGEEESNLVPVSEVMGKEHEILVQYIDYAARDRSRAVNLVSSPMGGGKRRQPGTVDGVLLLVPDNAMNNVAWIYLVLNRGRITRNYRCRLQKVF